MTPQAYIIHQTGARVRLRVKAKRQDADYFAALRSRIEAVHGIDEVRVNSTTGSVILLHPELPYSKIEPELRNIDLFELAAGPEPETPALTPLRSGISKANQALSETSSGSVDLRTLVVVGAIGLAIHQMLRGNLLGPALPLVWRAVDLAMSFRDAAGNADPEPDADTATASAKDTETTPNSNPPPTRNSKVESAAAAHSRTIRGTSWYGPLSD